MQLQSNAPEPGQDIATEIIGPANTLYEQGNTLTVKWVPGHREIVGNEAANAYTKDAAERRIPDKDSLLAADWISASFLKSRAAEWKTCRWKEDTEIRDHDREYSGLWGPSPSHRSAPSSRPSLKPSLNVLPDTQN